jgi:hypothetical protein
VNTSLPSRPVHGTSKEGDGGHLPEPAARGATVIPEAVVARLTTQAACEALGRQTGASLAIAGLGTPRCTATVHHGTARIAVSVDLPYPVDIARSCGELEHEITERVSHLTGMPVGDTRVSVHRFVLDESHRPRRVR